ncbi:hypothetical protein CIHG_03263 [Coccidioides immitis H538.4]|uniref:Uncharacterized protein n=2 Tax=Coccidioides immitis TaxID=5501 RepID=A0A0J8RJY8_COCIT|nr:hypothetical protein CIRG_00958 [Coccidioides immitis RMSCC 2394]KMU85480.1 hypothetical protein CIHG_03263 [Coccidioides immitis H538.4]
MHLQAVFRPGLPTSNPKGLELPRASPSAPVSRRKAFDVTCYLAVRAVEKKLLVGSLGLLRRSGRAAGCCCSAWKSEDAPAALRLSDRALCSRVVKMVRELVEVGYSQDVRHGLG